MRRAGKRTVGIVAVGLLVAMVVAAIFGAALFSAPHAGARNAPAASHSTNLGTMVRPAAAPSAASATVSILTNLGKYTILPQNLELKIVITGSSIKTNTSLWVTVTDNVTGAYCQTGSLNQTMKAGFTYYNLSLNAVSMGGVAFTNCPFIQSDQVIFDAVVTTVNNTTGTPSSSMDSVLSPATALVYQPLNVGLLLPESAVGAGNVSIVAAYTDQYVDTVQINVTHGGTSVFTASMKWANPTTPAVGVWFVSSPGIYPYALTITTAYGTLTVNGNFTVLSPGGGTVYQNSSTWKNASIFPGLTGAVSGTILLVVGLILGMIVALVVGRSLMRPASVAPAQQWQPGGATPANTCSVCGKSFGTPDELKEHAKTEHGMT
jgi:hypothetical protein